MKLKTLLACLFLGFIAVSCIKDEAPNAEADIVSCTLPNDELHQEAIINNDKIFLTVKKGVNVTQLTPEFTLTPGATISPASGVVRDFTNPQTYTVTSEDKQWSKEYEISVDLTGIPTFYNFSDTVPVKDKKNRTIYYNFRDQDLLGNVLNWANANEGYNYTGSDAGPLDYPTSPATDGLVGDCVKLTTKSTGSLGAMLKMYIASGNLFMGSFKLDIGNVLRATKFGVPFTHVPTVVKGFYKYKAGSVFTVNGKPVSGRKDICDIYAVFYETDKNVHSLDGTNVFTSPNLISVARINNAKETDQWTAFRIPFVLKEGKTIDPVKLENGEYNVAIVFASSIKGDLFEGAVGSTLYIDEVELDYTDQIPN